MYLFQILLTLKMKMYILGTVNNNTSFRIGFRNMTKRYKILKI